MGCTAYPRQQMSQFREGSVLTSVVTLPPAPELWDAHLAKACLHDAAAPSSGVTRIKSWAPATVQTTKPPFPQSTAAASLPRSDHISAMAVTM